MTLSAFAVRAVLALSSTFVILAPEAAFASDSLLIWSPAKLSSNAYRLRMGAKTATTGALSGGVDLSVSTSSTGRIRNTRDNARVWAEMKGQGGSGVERNATAGYNPATGRVSASAGVTRRWMASPSVDVVVTPSVSADTNVRHGYGGSVRLTQKAQLQAVQTGTSFTASGTTVHGQGKIASEFGVEQRVFDGLNLAASVRRENAELVGAIRARFALNW